MCTGPGDAGALATLAEALDSGWLPTTLLMPRARMHRPVLCRRFEPGLVKANVLKVTSAPRLRATC
jgi:hypothetical protein